ncbi:MAG: hypothetical protein NXI09_05690 [Bacteroidetes bacterium]|nr:hypothetical protein [Bacteroidota bacterium]
MPKTNYFIFLLIGYCLNLHCQNWQALSPFPGTAVDDGLAFSIGDTAYFGSGLSPWFSAQHQFQAFNLVSETWQSVQDLPATKGRQYAVAFADSQYAFVFGGYAQNEYLNDLWRYNPAIDQWQEFSPLPDSGRSGASAFLIGDTAYIFGGKNRYNDALSEVWAYALNSDTWTRKGDLPIGLWRSSATSLRDTGWLVFGIDSNQYYRNELYSYNPQLDQWTLISSFPGAGRSHASLLATEQNLVLAFGIDSLQNYYRDLWQYEPSSDQWLTLKDLPAAGRKGQMAIAHQNKLYFCTGINASNQRLKELWKFEAQIGLEEVAIRPKPEIIGRYDLQGRSVHRPSKQIIILLYADGSHRKLWID